MEEEKKRAKAITVEEVSNCSEEKKNEGEVCHTEGDEPAQTRLSCQLRLKKRLLKKPSLSMDESESIPIMKMVRRESIVFKALDRSSDSYQKVSQRADSAIESIEKVLDSNKKSQ